MHYKRQLAVLVIGLVALFTVLPALAEVAPTITLAPRWSAATALTSVNSDGNLAVFPSDNNDNTYDPTGGLDDEVNYVSVDLMVTTSVEIWAVDISCSVPNTVLDLYAVDATSNTDNLTDDAHPFQESAAWSVDGTPYTVVRNGSYAAGSSTIRVVASKMGQTQGLGITGIESTISLGRVTFRIKPQSNSVTSVIVPLTCSPSFVNRSGGPAAALTKYTPPAPLLVSNGYVISGNVTMQVPRPGTGIGVSCQTNLSSPNNSAPVVRTDPSGAFTVGGLRSFGYYRCQYFANVLGIEAPTSLADKDVEPFLAGQSFVPLTSLSYLLQPIVLRAGNTERTGTSIADVDLADLSAVTGANFGSPALLPAPFDTGDANGDRKIDKTDLALVTSNYGVTEYVPQGHYLVTGPVSHAVDSRIHIATTPEDWATQDLRQLVPGANRDYWPSVSPDGSQIAFVRSIGAAATQRYALFVMPATGLGTPTQMTPANADYDAFAPSWSPDGKQIAFIRTPVSVTGSTATHTYGIDRGWLTLIDVPTRSINLTLGIETRIYPAAWGNPDQVIYGSTVTHTLETLHIAANTTEAVDENTQGGGYEDMPNFLNGHLYYRYEPDGNFATVDAELRFATPGITSTGVVTGLPVFNPSPTPNGIYHIKVPTSLQAIGYYSIDGVRETLVMQFAQGSYSLGNWQTAYLTNGGSLASALPVWVGLTSLNSPLALNAPWNGNSATPTDLHALRATIRWLP